MTAYSENPSFNFRVKDYKRSWFSSYAESEINITIMNEMIPISLEHEIEHCPSLMNGELAKIVTRVKFSEKIENELNYYFKDSPPIEIITKVGILGDQDIEFTVPSFKGPLKGKDDININWQKLDGKIEMSSDMSNYVGKMQAPLIAINGNNGETAKIDNIVMTMNMKQRAEGIWLGNGGFNIASVYFKNTNKDTNSDNMEMNLKGISIDQITSEKDGLLLLSMISRADSLTMMDKTFEKMVIDLEIRNVGIDTLIEMQNKMKTIAEKQLPLDETNSKMIETMTTMLPELLKHSPEYNIKRLSVSSDKGDINGNASIKYVGNGDYMAFNPLNDLACSAMLSMPKEFLREILLAVTRKQISNYLLDSGTEMAEEEFENQCQQAVDNNIKAMLLSNFIIDDADNYTAQFALGDNGITLNGKTLNFPLIR